MQSYFRHTNPDFERSKMCEYGAATKGDIIGRKGRRASWTIGSYNESQAIL